MAILKYIIPLLFPLLLTGCYEDFIPDIDAKPVICINSLITAGKPIEVKISHTWMYTDQGSDGDHSIPDAEVLITVNGVRINSDYIPAEGDQIFISVTSPTYGEAHAEVTVPYAVDAKLISATPALTNSWSQGNEWYRYEKFMTFNLTTRIKIIDMAETENFYRLSAMPYYMSYDDQNWDDTLSGFPYPPYSNLYIGYFDSDVEPIFAEHIGVFETVMGGGSYGFTFFTDRQFSGRDYTLNLHYSDCNYSVRANEYDPELYNCGFILTLHSISRSYYDWANCQWQRYDGIFDDLSEIGFSDPLWAYSNVSTGAGVVAAQSFTTIKIPLDTFLSSSLPIP